MRFDHVPRDVRIGCRVFHQGEDPAGHETGRANRSAAARHFRHRDKAATGFDLDPAAVPGRDDVIGADLPARINDDLHTVAPHKFTVLRAHHITGAMPRGASYRHRRCWINAVGSPELLAMPASAGNRTLPGTRNTCSSELS